VASNSEVVKTLRPLGWWGSLVLFGVPAAMFAAGIYGAMPWLIERGWHSYYAYNAALGLPMVLMVVAALVAVRLEERRLDWSTLCARLRLRPMTGRAWLLALGSLVLCSGLGFSLVNALMGQVLQAGWLRTPEELPTFFDPMARVTVVAAYDLALGGIQGNWWAVGFTVGMLALNVVAEEFWWRGVILPRQELVWGRSTWAIHGVLWAVFHAYKWWSVPGLIPIALGLAWVCQREESTTPGLLIHLVTNGVGLIPLVAGVMGLLG